MSRALALVIVCAAGCVPYYRVGQVQLAHARDWKQNQALLEHARAALRTNDARAAVRDVERAIDRNPGLDGETYVLLARARLAAGSPREARATARWVLAHRPDGAAGARDVLIESFVAEKLYANALDFVEPATLDGVAANPRLAPRYAGLVEAFRLAFDQEARQPMLDQYGAWLAGYGVEDHPILLEARGRIAIMGVMLTGELPARVREAARSGDARAAALRFGVAFRYLPREDAEALARDVGAVVAAVPPPLLALDEAARGDDALAHDRLGEAIAAYRRAVAAAPWWPNAHRNLSMLLARAERYDAAESELRWSLALDASPDDRRMAAQLRDAWRARGAGRSAQ